MCDEGRNTRILPTGRATRIIHLMIVVLFFAPLGAAASAQSSTFLGQTNASDSVVIYATPTAAPTEIPAAMGLSGLILDAKGNKVPGAYVLLYRDSGTAPVSGNPTYTGSEAGSDYGEYHFSGLRPGKYTVYAEKSDIFLYNGSASITLTSGIDTRLNVIIKGYDARPVPVQTPMPVFAAISAPAATVLPSSGPPADTVDDLLARVKEKNIAPLIILFVIAMAGAGVMALRDLLKPKNKEKAIEQKSPAIEKKANAGNDPAKATAPTMSDNSSYMAEIEDLARTYDARGAGGAATLDMINMLSKKYGIDQGTIFFDIKKARGGKR